MPSGLQHPIVRVTTGKLNTVNDSTAGGSVADITGLGQAPGQVGGVVWLDENSPTAFDSSVGTLYPGAYQYVQIASDSAQPSRGHILFWKQPTSTTAPYVVTKTATDGNQAGVYINASSGSKALVPGNFGFIQISGIASVLFGTITKVSPVTKDLVFCTSGDNTGDVIADATAITSPILKRKLGIAEGAPANTTISLVKLSDLGRNV